MTNLQSRAGRQLSGAPYFKHGSPRPQFTGNRSPVIRRKGMPRSPTEEGAFHLSGLWMLISRCSWGKDIPDWGDSFHKVHSVFRKCCFVTKLYPTLCNPWTVACQAPLSMGFFRQEYWSGLPFPSPGIFLTQGLNLPLLHWRVDSLPRSHRGNPLFCTFRKWWTLKRSIDCIWLSHHRPWQSTAGDVIAILSKICDPALSERLCWSENWAMGSICHLSRQSLERASLNSSRGKWTVTQRSSRPGSVGRPSLDTVFPCMSEH